ncbi:MAG: hypothetical protein U9Q15_00345 [Patescibacteria group bacterium]|nr:hypothetical protein [Patescibacteria group bacterium]
MIALCLFLFAWNKYLVITDTVLSQSFWGRIYLFEIPLVILVLLAGVLFLLRPYVVHDYSVIEKVSGLMILGLLLIVCYFLDDMQAIALLGLRIAMVVSIIYFWKRISHSAKNIIAAIGVASLFVQIIIAGGQIDTGASLGLTQWMGESVLSLGSTSIASFSVYGIDILRGYGTLPHPNILAFLAFVLYLSSLVLGHIKKPLRKMIQGLSLFLLFLTFSRVFWVLVVFLFIMRSKHKIFWAAFSGLLFLGGILLRGYQSLWERFDLYLPTLKLVLDNPLGVGVSQFITSIPAYYTEFFLWMAQPVHNTFLLIAVEIGWL